MATTLESLEAQVQQLITAVAAITAAPATTSKSGLTGEQVKRMVELQTKEADAPETLQEHLAIRYFESDKYARAYEKQLHADRWAVKDEARRGRRQAKRNHVFSGLSECERAELAALEAQRSR